MRRTVGPVDPPTTSNHPSCFSSFLVTRRASWYPDNRSRVHNRLSLPGGICDLDITMQHKLIFGCLDILVWLTRLQQRAWPTYLPTSFLFLPLQTTT